MTIEWKYLRMEDRYGSVVGIYILYNNAYHQGFPRAILFVMVGR